MSEELKAARILFIIAAILSFLGSLVFIGLGVLGMTTGMEGLFTMGGLAIAGGIFLGISGGLKLWCANLVKEEKQLTTAGVLGIILGIIPGDVIALIAGILVLVKKEEVNEDSPATKSRKKKSSKKKK
ncbi:MAG: hypothetical protein ABEI74_01640 [Candidatus Pacearchaeota archaeon]